VAILTAQTYTLAVASSPLDVVSDQVVVTMDEGNSPWLTATAIVQRPADAVFALLDPAKNQTITLTLVAPVTLTLTLRVQGRAYDPDADTVALVLVSNEYPMLTYAPATTVDLRASTYQSSVRNIASAVVTAALGKSTTVQLASGTTNRAFPTYAAGENLMANPNVTTLSGFAGSSSPANQYYPVEQDTSQKINAAQVRASAAGNSYVQMVFTGTPASAGQQYGMSVLARATNYNITGTIYIQFRDANGVTLTTVSKSVGTLPVLFSSATRVGMTATAPGGTATVAVYLRGSGSGLTSGHGVVGAQWTIIEGDGLDTDGQTYTYFQGDTASGTSGYTYAWTGSPNASSSTRTPIVERDPASLLWTPSSTADEFLRPILEATGLRLFQNEAGAFILADNGYKVPGQVVMQRGSTLYGATESTSIMDTDADGFPLNADAVIITYSWTDALGRPRTATDTAKATTAYSRPYVLEKPDTPYPGPGQAKFLLTRLLARTRQIATKGRPDWNARPGMSAVVSLPNRPTATGYVQALEFDLAAVAMTVTTKNLVTTPPGSVGNAPITQTIGAVSGTIAAYTN